MKNGIIILFFVFVSVQLQAQQKENYTVIRLVIVSDDNELLLRKTKYGWMTPAINYKTKQTQTEVIDSLSSGYGIQITDIKLAGVFTYRYVFADVVSTRLFYVAKHKNGILRSSSLDEEVFWVPKNIALEKLGETVDSLKLMISQVLNFPNTLWGGAFLLLRDQEKNLRSKQIEGFYSLRS